MRVRVTKEALAANRQDPGGCAIWRALYDMGYRHISIDLDWIKFSDPQERLRYTYMTPARIVNWLKDFDDGLVVDDRNFLFNLPASHLVSISEMKKLSSAEVLKRREAQKKNKGKPVTKVRRVRKNRRKSRAVARGAKDGET